MKKIISILSALLLCFTFYSCVTSTYAQTDDMYDDVDVNVIITYGTPYYNTNGLLLYYMYRDMYYYPYYYNNTYYFHRYYRPLPPHRMGRYKPIPRDFYKHGNIYRHHKYSRPNTYRQHSIPNTHRHNSQLNHNRHNFGNRGIRPNNMHQNRSFTPRSSTRHHHYGGRR